MELVKLSYDYIKTEDLYKLSELKTILELNGIKPNKYVGKPEKFFDTKEKKNSWFLGQALYAINKVQEGDVWGYVALNHWLHMASNFIKEAEDSKIKIECSCDSPYILYNEEENPVMLVPHIKIRKDITVLKIKYCPFCGQRLVE
jgi:hypothetical protein